MRSCFAFSYSGHLARRRMYDTAARQSAVWLLYPLNSGRAYSLAPQTHNPPKRQRNSPQTIRGYDQKDPLSMFSITRQGAYPNR